MVRMVAMVNVDPIWKPIFFIWHESFSGSLRTKFFFSLFEKLYNYGRI